MLFIYSIKTYFLFINIFFLFSQYNSMVRFFVFKNVYFLTVIINPADIKITIRSNIQSLYL